MKAGKEKQSKKTPAPELKAKSKPAPPVPFAGPYIAMDFGTSFLVVSMWNNGKVEVVANEDGFRTTPAYVSFTENEVLLGENARSQLFRNPKNTIYDIKKILGRTYEELKEKQAMWPFTIKQDKDAPAISITLNGTEKLYKPTEIAGMLFARMKSLADVACGTSVKKVVITMPSSFNEKQKSAIIEAVRNAGMEPIKLIHEATAAVLSYNYDKIASKSEKDAGSIEKRILVFHLGGGSFDLVLFRSLDGIVELVGQYNDPELRGKRFDDRIIRHCIQEFEKKNHVSLSQNIKAIKKLELICEAAKVVLSVASSVPIEADSLAEGIDFSTTLYRAKYEELCSDLFSKTIPPIEKLLTQHGLTKKDVDDIIIEGGLGKTPKVTELLKEYFGKEPRSQIDPEEAVAYGAAVQSAFLAGATSNSLLESTSIGTTPLSIGIEAANGQVRVLIPRNTPIPLKRSFALDVRKPTAYILATEETKPYVATIKLFQGESLLARNNKPLAFVSLEYPMGPQKQVNPIIELTVELYASGNITILATDKANGKEKIVRLSCPEFNTTQKTVEEMCENAAKGQAAEKELLAAVAELKNLKEYCYNVAAVAQKASAAAEAKKEFSAGKVKGVVEWVHKVIEGGDMASAPATEVMAECAKRKKELEEGLKNLLMAGA